MDTLGSTEYSGECGEPDIYQLSPLLAFLVALQCNNLRPSILLIRFFISFNISATSKSIISGRIQRMNFDCGPIISLEQAKLLPPTAQR